MERRTIGVVRCSDLIHHNPVRGTGFDQQRFNQWRDFSAPISKSSLGKDQKEQGGFQHRSLIKCYLSSGSIIDHLFPFEKTFECTQNLECPYIRLHICTGRCKYLMIGRVASYGNHCSEDEVIRKSNQIRSVRE